MSYVADNYDLWEAYDRKQAQQLEKLPVCGYCRNEIQDDFCYEINEEPVCAECLEIHFKKAADYFL